MTEISTWLRTRLGALFPPRRKSAVRKLLSQGKALLGKSGYFDGQWYLAAYPDVAAAGIEPLRHYLLYGALEGRDPGPWFSSSGYRLACPEPFAAEINPLSHFLQTGRALGCSPLPVLPGACKRIDGAPTILVCGHQAGSQVFGAERGMLDVLCSLKRLGYNVLVSLPAAGCAEYLDQVRSSVQRVWIIPYVWWRQGRLPCQETVQLFAELMEQQRVSLVLLNTSVLFEPALAARQCRVPVFVHVREIPDSDPALCQLLHSDPGSFRRHLLSLVDRVIANSGAVERYLDCPEKTVRVPDCLDPAPFDLPTQFERPPFRVGLISSNLPKKGLADFVDLAKRLHQLQPHLSCLLIGPENEHVSALRAAASRGELPTNFFFVGYAATPQEALQQVDIVVNLSRVQESFGRTVLEAMAARRPVVCYDWGGLKDLVVDGQTGFLVPWGDVVAVAERICELVESPDLYRRLGERGRVRVLEYFGTDSLDRGLRLAFEQVDSAGPGTKA